MTAAAVAWAAACGIPVDDEILDIGVSAFRGKNRTVGALSAFLKLMEDGRIERGSYLIVESLDRLSCEIVLDALPRFIDLIQAGIVIVTLMDRQEYSRERLKADWSPLILSLAIMARAHEESQTKSDRVGKVWARKRSTAQPGIVLTRRIPDWLEVRKGKIVPIPDRVNTVRRIFRETLDGCGRRTLATRLNKDKGPPFQGGDGWHVSSIGTILRSRSVFGDCQGCRAHHRRARACRRRQEGQGTEEVMTGDWP